MRPKGRSRLVLALSVGLAVFRASTASAATAAAGPFPDVPAGHWAAGPIEYVDEHQIISARPEGFGPGDLFTRRELVRALAALFPPPAGWTPNRTFSDLPVGDPLYPVADYAVRRYRVYPVGDQLRPAAMVSKRDLDLALVRALGFGPEAAGVSKIHTADGVKLAPSWTTGYLIVASRLGLHDNLSDENAELRPGEAVSRAHAALAFARVAELAADPGRASWSVEGFRDIVLPKMTPARVAAVKWALSFAGYPYIWGGEWHRPTLSSYPFGAQPNGGFDCSGYIWWVLAQPGNEGYPVTRWRPYEGYSVPQRTATEMSRVGTRYALGRTLPMDIAFFELNDDPARFEHAGLLLGNGWMIHSTGSRGGVTLEQMGPDSWWRPHFAWARRAIPANA